LPRDAPPGRFLPRATLALGVGVALFLVVSLAYSLPVLLETPPPGAIADYTRERVHARLEGKAFWLLGGSILVSAAAFAWTGRARGAPPLSPRSASRRPR
jgi:hypothetical protein